VQRRSTAAAHPLAAGQLAPTRDAREATRRRGRLLRVARQLPAGRRSPSPSTPGSCPLRRLLSSPPALMLLTGVAFSSAPALAKQVVVDVLHRREPPGPWITRPVVLNARRKPKLTTHMFDLASSVFASSNLSVSFLACSYLDRYNSIVGN